LATLSLGVLTLLLFESFFPLAGDFADFGVSGAVGTLSLLGLKGLFGVCLGLFEAIGDFGVFGLLAEGDFPGKKREFTGNSNLNFLSTMVTISP